MNWIEYNLPIRFLLQGSLIELARLPNKKYTKGSIEEAGQRILLMVLKISVIIIKVFLL